MPKDELVGKKKAWLNRIFTGTQGKNVYDLWKEGQATQEEYKDVIRCREEIRKEKAQLEFNIATALKDNKVFFTYTSKTKGEPRRISILY